MQRQPNRVVSNVKGCYIALMVMPVVSQGGVYTIAPPPSQYKYLYIEGGAVVWPAHVTMNNINRKLRTKEKVLPQ